MRLLWPEDNYTRKLFNEKVEKITQIGDIQAAVTTIILVNRYRVNCGVANCTAVAFIVTFTYTGCLKNTGTGGNFKRYFSSKKYSYILLTKKKKKNWPITKCVA